MSTLTFHCFVMRSVILQDLKKEKELVASPSKFYATFWKGKSFSVSQTNICATSAIFVNLLHFSSRQIDHALTRTFFWPLGFKNILSREECSFFSRMKNRQLVFWSILGVRVTVFPPLNSHISLFSFQQDLVSFLISPRIRCYTSSCFFCSRNQFFFQNFRMALDIYGGEVSGEVLNSFTKPREAIFPLELEWHL